MRLVYIALAWIAGVIYAASGALIFEPVWWSVAGASLLLTLLLRRFEWLLLGAAALGILRFAASPRISDIARYNDTGYVTVEGTISAAPDQRETATLFRISSTTITRRGITTATSGSILVSTPRITDGHYGDHIQISGRLETPSESDRFSYSDYLARQGIYSILSAPDITVLEPGSHADLTSALIDLKLSAKSIIAKSLPEPQASLLTGILLGDDRGLSPEVSDAFAETGAAHIIAISGFNMVVLGGFVSALLKRSRLPPLPSALVSIAVIAAYTLFVGASAAIVRAAFMSSVAFFGGAIRRKTYTPASLAFTVLVLTAIDPLALWDVGFQLSAFAVLGIALFAQPLDAIFELFFGNLPKPLKPVGELFREALTVGLAALAFTLPLSSLYFGRLSPGILIVNALIEPVQPILMLLGGLALLVSVVLSPLGQALFWADMLPLTWTLGIVRLFARLPEVIVYPPPGWIAAGIGGVIAAAMVRATRPRWLEGLSKWTRSRAIVTILVTIAGVLAVLGFLLFQSRPDGMLHVWFLDLGSSTVLIQTPSGAHMLIDGGNYPARMLTALGDHLPFNDNTIEVQFITEPNDTLLGALPVVYERYRAEQVVINGHLTGTETLDAVQNALQGFPTADAEIDQELDTSDGLRIMVTHSSSIALDGKSTPNERDANALVLKLLYGDVSLLLTGELNQEGQEYMLRSEPTSTVTVLQVPRSGRDRSVPEGWIVGLAPQIAIVQMDRLSRRVTPNPETLAQYDAAQLYRTDESGTIHFYTDGKQVWIETAE